MRSIIATSSGGRPVLATGAREAIKAKVGLFHGTIAPPAYYFAIGVCAGFEHEP